MIDTEIKELRHLLLTKYANAENSSKDRSAELSRREAQRIQRFAVRVNEVYESLEEVCKVAEAKVRHDKH